MTNNSLGILDQIHNIERRLAIMEAAGHELEIALFGNGGKLIDEFAGEDVPQFCTDFWAAYRQSLADSLAFLRNEYQNITQNINSL